MGSAPLWSGMGEEDREQRYAGLAASPPLGRAAPDDAAKAFLALMDQDWPDRHGVGRRRRHPRRPRT
ncbi:hypothetical protein AB0955_09915 [Streptomyces cellulosae]